MSKLDDIASHIKESMCIDGSVDFTGYVDDIGTTIQDTNGEHKVLQGALFECNDSKRGQFFIGWYIEDDCELKRPQTE